MRQRQNGVALVLVLWVITLLTVIAGNFAYSMRGEAQIAANLLQSVQAQTRADAGVQFAWFQLMRPVGDPGRWQANGAMHQVIQDGVAVQVSVLDEAGKIDLNTASDGLLKGLFKSVGLDDQASAVLTDVVLDWRSPGSLKRLNGAKEGDYRAAGKDYGPPNAPFETIDEVQRVLGMTPELYRRIAPALTVYSRRPGVDTRVAPREVLLAIPGANPAMVEAFLRQRDEALANGQPLPSFAGAGAFASAGSLAPAGSLTPAGSLASISIGSPAYSVRSEVRMADGSGFVRVAVGRVSPDPRQPIKLLAWGEGDTERPAVNNTTARN